MGKKKEEVLVEEWLCDPHLDGCTLKTAIEKMLELEKVHGVTHTYLTLHFDEESGYCKESLYGQRPETKKETLARVDRDKRTAEMTKVHELKQLEALKKKYDRT